VDKFLKGAGPTDFPVEEPTRFILAVNLKTATALAITVQSEPRVLSLQDHASEIAGWRGAMASVELKVARFKRGQALVVEVAANVPRVALDENPINA
jgi:hypothetical protein